MDKITKIDRIEKCPDIGKEYHSLNNKIYHYICKGVDTLNSPKGQRIIAKGNNVTERDIEWILEALIHFQMAGCLLDVPNHSKDFEKMRGHYNVFIGYLVTITQGFKFKKWNDYKKRSKNYGNT